MDKNYHGYKFGFYFVLFVIIFAAFFSITPNSDLSVMFIYVVPAAAECIDRIISSKIKYYENPDIIDCLFILAYLFLTVVLSVAILTGTMLINIKIIYWGLLIFPVHMGLSALVEFFKLIKN